jgi:hypothetical protein
MITFTALTAAMRYILKAESDDRRGARRKLYRIIAGSAVYFNFLQRLKYEIEELTNLCPVC